MDPARFYLQQASLSWDSYRINENNRFGQVPVEIAVLIASKILLFSDPIVCLQSLRSFALTSRKCYLIKVKLLQNPDYVCRTIQAIIDSVYFLHKPIGIGPTDKHGPLRYYGTETSIGMEKCMLMDVLRIAWNRAADRIEQLIATGASTQKLQLKGLKALNIHHRLSSMSVTCPTLNDLDLRNTCSLDVGMQIAGFNPYFESTLLLMLSKTALGEKSFKLALNQLRFIIPENGKMTKTCQPMINYFSRDWRDRAAVDEWLFVHGGLSYCTHVSQPEIVYPFELCLAENTWFPRVMLSPCTTNIIGLRLTSMADETVGQLLNWPRLTHLTSLHLFLNKFGHISEVSRLFLSKSLTSLTVLKLDTVPFQKSPEENPADGLVQAICASTPNLRTFSLGAIPVSDFTLQTILSCMTQLRRVEVCCFEPLSESSIAALENETHRYKLTSLSLLDHSLTKKIIQSWKEKGIAFPAMRKMTLNGRCLDDNAVEDLLAIFRSLTTLNLGRTSGEPCAITSKVLQSSIGDLKKKDLSRKNEVASILHPAPTPTIVPLTKRKRLRKNITDKPS